jgi:FdhE protein
MKATVRIVPQGEIAGGTAEPPALKLPDPATFFAQRAARLRHLDAQAAQPGGYLELMACLAAAQQAALAAHSRCPLPGTERLERSRSYGLPPLPAEERTPAWRESVRVIAARLGPRLPRELAGAEDAHLEYLAERVLDFDYPAVDPRVVPFVGAALQVHWMRRAADLGVGAFGKLDVPNVCPVCGSPPVASALRIDVPVPGSRYLHCALCGTDWHLPRGQCTHCGGREKIGYFHVEGDAEVVKAEACEECRSYLKVVNQEKDPLADPVADDLASLALDVLMDESGYQRAGPNLFFVPGQT